MQNNLKDALYTALNSGIDSTPVLNVLINDYVQYHIVFVVLSSLFLILFVVLGILFWKKFKALPSLSAHDWSFEKKLYVCFSVLSFILTLFFSLLISANVSNILNPQKGFVGSIAIIKTPSQNTTTAKIQDEFNVWLQSQDTTPPSAIQEEISKRLAWQKPKAISSVILLILSAVLAVTVWRKSIEQQKNHPKVWNLKGWALLLLGILIILMSLILILMIIGNTQAVFAPLLLTLLFS